MKTLKALKITSILNGIFCFFCVASTVCFAITRYYDSNLFFSIGNILIYGWMINPIGIISFVIRGFQNFDYGLCLGLVTYSALSWAHSKRTK